MPDSFHPESFESRFIEGIEDRLLLEGERNRRKREILVRSAFWRVEDPGRRSILIGATEAERTELVQISHDLFDGELPGQYTSEFREWRFLSGAVVKIAAGLQEATRFGATFDRVCIDHAEDFGLWEVEAMFGLVRTGAGRAPTVRATHIPERNIRELFPEAISFRRGGRSFEALTRKVSRETAALESVVLALTAHLHATHDGETWARVIQARLQVPHEHHEAEFRDLLYAIDTSESDRRRLLTALERARHRLAEKEGAPAGACHRTCPQTCSLRVQGAA
ncbi:hypothetical protein [Sorangium sp. So ce388]|uniref:hypothetical protein n=1 Tax=Sorangium sp. So ce388 TaxID=3133309 RepID=UPI003F5B66CE